MFSDVITVVSPQFEYEKIVKALAGGNMKSICRAFLPILISDRRLHVSKVS